MRKKNAQKKSDDRFAGNPFGRQVYDFRFSREYKSQEWMALFCGVSLATIRRVEAGKTVMHPISIDKITKAMAEMPEPQPARKAAKEAMAS